MILFRCMLLLLALAHGLVAKPKNILFIVVDDLGWADLGYFNPKISTPNIDKLASSGIILNQSYAYSVCTPSRNSFLTGLYAEHTGLNHDVLYGADPFGLPTQFKLMPEYLEKYGYSSHIVGKWHLGFCNQNFTPAHRGFDSFYGFFNGQERYYSHRFDLFERDEGLSADGLDFWFQTRNKLTPITDKNFTHSMDLFTQRTLDLISAHHVTQKPFFIYLATQNVHIPYELPPENEIPYEFVKNNKRRKLLALVTMLDEAIGRIVEQLKEYNMLEDTVIGFTSDNGGPVYQSGQNYPLRGSKATIFEGGTRVRAFLNVPDNKPHVNDGMFHAVDWMPTLIGAALDQDNELAGVDGMNHWPRLRSAQATERQKFIYSIDPYYDFAGVRDGDWKLMVGCAGGYDGWYEMLDTDESFNITENYTCCDENEPKCVYLYNIREDPYERNNLANERPEILKRLTQTLAEFNKTTVKPINDPNMVVDDKGLPRNQADRWQPGWC